MVRAKPRPRIFRKAPNRKIYLPEFVITLIRTPFLPPRYASFQVPLEFNKLEMRNYMRNVYNVEALRIRSYVQQQKVTRERRDGRQGYGPLRRPKSLKRMTIEMEDPFVWPEHPKDQSPWEKDQFFSHQKYGKELQEANHPSASSKPVKDQAETFEKQAKELAEGKATWKPTWQTLGLRYDRPALKKFSVSQPPTKKGEIQSDLGVETIDASATRNKDKPAP